MPRKVSPESSLESLKKEAKRWLKSLRGGNPEARERFEKSHPAPPATPGLRDVQLALARECGFEGWTALKGAVQEKPESETILSDDWTAEEWERLANDWLLAFQKDASALERLNRKYGRSFTQQDVWAEVWRRVYAFRQRSFQGPENTLRIEEARTMIAQDAGYSSWDALTKKEGKAAPRVPPYFIDESENRISPRRRLSGKEWDQLIAVMRERRIPALDANGLMTDDVLARVARLDHVTALSLAGSRELTDEGIAHLARMPQLRELSLDEYPGGRLTDRALEALGHLPELRRFTMTWQRGVSDAGLAHLRSCHKLEAVDLMGSPTGDAAIEALQGKPNLRSFKSGRLVTDRGLALLKGFPRMKRGGEREEDGAELLIDGPFTDQGLAGLTGLEGIVALDLFWHARSITPNGFAHLARLPHLRYLGADGDLTDDVGMGHIGAMPQLRRLRAQDTPAGDRGWEALSRCRTLEGIWARDCKNFGDRGLTALSKMPSLRNLGLHFDKVDQRAFAALPRFPSLTELTPMGVRDQGFLHIGRCERLERLTCMYCREIGDDATEQIAGLRRLKYYYASLNRITDRSLEILGNIPSLEEVELYECTGVTDAGLVFLKDLPRLRKVQFEAMPSVTFEGTRVFPKSVRVVYLT